jgi:hypothetical protein
MSIIYHWEYPSIDVMYSLGDLKNVVSTVHWVLVATEDEFKSSVYGSIGVPSPTPEHFISYEDLTEEEVNLWVVGALGGQEEVEKMMDSLAAQIEQQKNPKGGRMALPWSQS